MSKKNDGNGLDPEVASVLECQGDDNAIATVSELTRSAMKPGWMDFPSGDPRKVMVAPDGDLGAMWVPSRSYKAMSIAGFLEQVNDLAAVPGEDWAGDSKGELTNDVRIFVGDDRIVAVFNERTNRSDTVTLDLNKLESIKMLLSPDSSLKSLSQKQLEWLLRSTYADRVTPITFLPSIRKLKITGHSGGGSVVSHGRETKDLSIEAEIAGLDGDLPEEITLSSSIFAELADGSVPPEFRVRCAVLINVEKASFTIKPLEGEVARAMAAARRDVIARLKEVELPDNVVVFSDSKF